MNDIIEYSTNFEPFIKNVILKNCPYMEDRLHILENQKNGTIK